LNSEKIGKIWKKGKLNRGKMWIDVENMDEMWNDMVEKWKDMEYGKVSWIGKRYGKKASWIVKWYGRFLCDNYTQRDLLLLLLLLSRPAVSHIKKNCWMSDV
jgi:hypothetical protein